MVVFLKSINRLVSVMEKKCVYCEVGIGYFYALSGKVAIPYNQPQAEHNEAYSRKIQITTNQK
jgi:hypothetical protein